MTKFNIYDQQFPKRLPAVSGKEPVYQSNLVLVGQLVAPTASAALVAAKKQRMSRWPMVEDAEEENRKLFGAGQ